MNFPNIEVVITAIIVFLMFLRIFKSSDKDKEGRIKDKAVNAKNVVNCLKNFTVEINPKLKDGYTEKSIQNQLKKHLLQQYVHVVSEYVIEGINATKINFDIGNGQVGLELKIAKSVFKTANLQRLAGQIEDYQKYKYDSKNLIVAVFGEKIHTDDRVMLKRVKEKVEDKNVKFVYTEISKGKQ